MEELHGMTGAACDSPDTAPTWFMPSEAANGRGCRFCWRGSVSLDFVFAALLFSLVFGFSAVAYSNFSDQYFINEGKRDLETSALSISEMLVKSQGYPADWENDVSLVGVLGLAGSENVLSKGKVDAFGSLSYNETKELLGIGNEYYITIKSVDGQMLFSKGDELVNSSSVGIERIVYFDRSVCKLGVRLYEG